MIIIFLIEKRRKYKSYLTANRKRCATDNSWGNALSRLGINV